MSDLERELVLALNKARPHIWQASQDGKYRNDARKVLRLVDGTLELADAGGVMPRDDFPWNVVITLVAFTAGLAIGVWL